MKNSDRFHDVSKWLSEGLDKLMQFPWRFRYFMIDCQDNFDIFRKIIEQLISCTPDTDVFPVFLDRLLREF